MTNDSNSSDNKEAIDENDEKYLKRDSKQAELLPPVQKKSASIIPPSNAATNLVENFIAGHNERMKNFMAGHDKRMQMFQNVFEQTVGGGHDDEEKKEFIKAEMMCFIWKRRDGLAKLANSWERRVIALSDNMLLYFDAKNDFILDKNKCPSPEVARGKFDLKKIPLRVYITSDSTSPSLHCIAIKPKSDPGNNKGWKICFDDIDEQMKWLTEISKIIAVKSSSMKRKNRDFDSKEDAFNSNASDSDQDHQVESDDDEGRDEQTKVIVSKGSDSSPTSVFEKWNDRILLGGKNLIFAVVAFNIAFFSGTGIWFILLIDIILFTLVETSSPLAMKMQSSSIEKSVRKKKSKLQQYSEKALEPGFSTVREDSEGSEFTDKAKWSVPKEKIMVRSRTYLKDRLKIASDDPLYELLDCDVFVSSCAASNFSSRIDLAKLQVKPANIPHVPDILIFSLSLPLDAPKLSFGASVDTSRSVTVLFYFRVSDRTIQLIKDSTILDDSRNAVNLWTKWCECAEDPTSELNKKVLSRFKLIPLVLNPDECGLPSTMSGYNNKPMLVKRIGITGLINRGTLPTEDDSNALKTMEFNINFHEFPFIAKQAFSFLAQNIVKNCEVVIGFVIEGREEDELSEVICGTGQLCRPDPINLIEVEP